MSVKIPTVKMNDGKDIPVIGIGTYIRKIEPGKFGRIVEAGIDVGYRHVDTASLYKNEEEIGQAINKKIKEGVVNREELFITTKVWNDRHAEDEVVASLRESLDRLKLDYVNLYLIHWPMSVNSKGEDMHIDYLETWRGMEKVLELGLTKSIGVSNFNEDQLGRILQHGRVKPVVNQVEINATFTQHKLVDYCKKHDILPMAFTPLGLLSDARPEFADKAVIKTDPKLGAIAEKYGKSRVQIALRYLNQRGILVIPKTYSPARLIENASIFDFQLTEEEMKVVDSYNINHRCVPNLISRHYPNYPFNELKNV